MAIITKNIKPLSNYQVWTNADMVNGDILGIEESLGRPAKFISIESDGGSTIIKFNVVTKIFKNQETVGNTWVPDAAFFTSPQLAGEIEENKPNVIIDNDSTHHWREELSVRDIKIVALAPDTRITVS